MYSKFNDRPRPPRPSPPVGSPSYRRVRVPPGYRGLAIVDGEERLADAAPAADIPPAETPSADVSHASPTDVLPGNRDFGQGSPPEPRFDALDRVSDLPRREVRPVPMASSASAALFPAPAGEFFDRSHFPFGHGLGTEEWLIIGLILLLLHEAGSDRGDLDETVILLALLLLGG